MICASTTPWLRGRLTCSNWLIAEVFNLLKTFFKVWKRSAIALLPFHCDQSILGRALSQVNSPYFHIAARNGYFSYSSVYSAVQWVSICKCKAYWHMHFLLINGCGTHENKIHRHFCYQKSRQTSVRKNSINRDHSTIQSISWIIGIEIAHWNICRYRWLPLFHYFLLIIKLSTRISAGVDDCTTFYCYDPYLL